MMNIRDKLGTTLHNRGLAGETSASNQRKAFMEVAEYIEALEARVATLEKQLEEAANLRS